MVTSELKVVVVRSGYFMPNYGGNKNNSLWILLFPGMSIFLIYSMKMFVQDILHAWPELYFLVI